MTIDWMPWLWLAVIGLTRISQDEKRGEQELRQEQIDKEIQKAYEHFGVTGVEK